MTTERAPSTRPRRRSEILPSRLHPRDLAYLGSAGLRSRPMRTLLSALGIAIGIAAMIGVVGTSASSREQLDSQLAKLGTNMLSVTRSPMTGDPPPLPATAAARAERIPGVLRASTVADLADVSIYRNALVPAEQGGGLTVTAAELDMPDIVGAKLREGRWLNPATATLPVTVLGSTAAERLGVTDVGQLVWMGDGQALVIGILEPVTLAPELDVAALVGIPFATTAHRFDGSPTRLYERSADDSVENVRDLLPSSIQPAQPSGVAVSRPSDALAAAAAANEAFTGLLLAVGFIALVVGGIGVANTMIISVLERRREIGLRRALGATRGHIRLQFLTESLLLSLIGGIGGAVLGSAVILLIALANGWVPVIPPVVLVGAVASTLVIGAAAGLYPAMRAARTSPTAALTA